MFHHFSAAISGVAIRPARLGDEQLILELRADSAVSRFLGDIVGDAAAQRRWLEEYFHRPNDYYFVIEANGIAVGTVGLYGVEFKGDGLQAEWGRWVVRPPSMAGPASALLIYRFAFEVLMIDRVFCRTVDANASVLSFHSRSGANEVGRERRAVTCQGELRDVVVYEVSKCEWPSVKERLLRVSVHSERLL